MLSLLVRTLLGIKDFAPPAPARADPWRELHALAADPGSGLKLRGKPPL